MLDQAQKEAFATIVKQFEENVVELERGLSSVSNVLLGEGYIVMIENIATTYSIEETNGERRAVNARPCGFPYMAMRFSRRDAEQVAANTQNGRGTKGRAVHVREATEAELIETRRLLQIIKDRQADAE